jgi:hypothetical protein
MDTHKNGLAVRIYNFTFTCTESSGFPSGSRGICGVQGNVCERHDSKGLTCVIDIIKMATTVDLLIMHDLIMHKFDNAWDF